MTITPRRTRTITVGALVAATGLALITALPASAVPYTSGAIDLGVATSFGVLGNSSVTNTGPSVIDGDVGIYSGTSIGDFSGDPEGSYSGELHATDGVAQQAQIDLTDAINTAAALTPTQGGLDNLSGLSLGPGVYDGGAFIIDGGEALTLQGGADSVFVFRASSTLTFGGASEIILGADVSPCNVFWQISDSASLGTDSDFVGTIMAGDSISTTSGASVQGRLLANGAAVTLINTNVTVPTGCDSREVPATVAPSVTSTAPGGAIVGRDYSFTVTADGTPTFTYTVTSGALPAGLVLDSATGTISGRPTTEGTSTFTITVSNGTAPDASVEYTIVTAPVGTAPANELASTGFDLMGLGAGAALLVMGMTVIGLRRRTAAARR